MKLGCQCHLSVPYCITTLCYIRTCHRQRGLEIWGQARSLIHSAECNHYRKVTITIKDTLSSRSTQIACQKQLTRLIFIPHVQVTWVDLGHKFMGFGDQVCLKPNADLSPNSQNLEFKA